MYGRARTGISQFLGAPRCTSACALRVLIGYACKARVLRIRAIKYALPAAGEMVFPWMFEEFEALRPLREAADILANKADWPQLYDLATLQRNSVPVAGATYYEDMYVDFELAQVCSRFVHLV